MPPPLRRSTRTAPGAPPRPCLPAAPVRLRRGKPSLAPTSGNPLEDALDLVSGPGGPPAFEHAADDVFSYVALGFRASPTRAADRVVCACVWNHLTSNQSCPAAMVRLMPSAISPWGSSGARWPENPRARGGTRLRRRSSQHPDAVDVPWTTPPASTRRPLRLTGRPGVSRPGGHRRAWRHVHHHLRPVAPGHGQADAVRGQAVARGQFGPSAVSISSTAPSARWRWRARCHV